MELKVLQIGAGGIGSFFIEQVDSCYKKGYFNRAINLTLADMDLVELKQIEYQNFSVDEIGQPKVFALGKRYNLNVLAQRITKESQLNGYDIIIICADNDKVRKLVVEYCFKNNKQFIDIRSTGRKVFAMPKMRELKDNMKFIDSKDLNEYSCQELADLKSGNYQLGNKIAAVIGTQMLLNYIRGHDNRIINLIV